MAVMASTMTGVLRAKQTSWRPGTDRSVMEPSEMSYVLWVFLMLEVGLNATLNFSGLPLVIPPFTPPEPFFEEQTKLGPPAASGETEPTGEVHQKTSE